MSGENSNNALPIFSSKNVILESFATHDVILLIGETGSGKTTQLPQILLQHYESAHSKPHNNTHKTTDIPRIVVTQPRRIAAITVAERVAKERKVKLGTEVGFAVRFNDESSPTETKIRYVTDGILLKEVISDTALTRYNAVVIDEVHERSINTDVLLGVVKHAVISRKKSIASPNNTDNNHTYQHRKEKKQKVNPTSLMPLKLVIMSATTDAITLRNYLSEHLSVKIINVPGRLYPVQLAYSAEPIPDYVDAAVITVLQIHVDEPLQPFPHYAHQHNGFVSQNKSHRAPPRNTDILVFLPGQEDIDAAVNMTRERAKRYLGNHASKQIVPVPLYASMSPEQQKKAIEPLHQSPDQNLRKVIFATNIAETSITIEGIRYVVDSGVAKIKSISKRGGAEILQVRPISKAQCIQRSGRAGRNAPGKAYRLYTEETYYSLKEHATPEILRCDIVSAILSLIAMGIKRPHQFDFVDTPPRASFRRGLELLFALGALDEENMSLTMIGKWIVKLPLTPMLSRALIESKKVGCEQKMLSLAAILSTDTLFLTPKGDVKQADLARKRFASSSGDHLTWLNVFDEFVKLDRESRKQFCKDNFLIERSLLTAVSIRTQLDEIFANLNIDVEMLNKSTNRSIDELHIEEASKNRENALRRCLVAGYFQNCARLRESDNKYVVMGNMGDEGRGGIVVEVHPSSVIRLRREKPEFIIFNELVFTSKAYVRGVSVIDSSWLTEHSSYFQVER